eukprot:jgi/Mesen1/3496/ME000197S02514
MSSCGGSWRARGPRCQQVASLSSGGGLRAARGFWCRSRRYCNLWSPPTTRSAWSASGATPAWRTRVRYLGALCCTWACTARA